MMAMLPALLIAALLAAATALLESSAAMVVPNIVHQIYDYQYPNFFLFLSIACVQQFVKPSQHILWINEEGKYRKGQWDTWYGAATHAAETAANTASGIAMPPKWEALLARMIKDGRVEPRFTTFPAHPPFNASVFVSNKAHRSDFLRIHALQTIGGIYLDTDSFPTRSLDDLRIHNFTISYDNIINPDHSAPKRLNNGVLLSSPGAAFLQHWSRTYASFNPSSWDHHSCVVPFKLAMEYPDLVHVEMSRLSPLSYAFQTSEAAAALTCGVLSDSGRFILYPHYDSGSKAYAFHKDGIEASKNYQLYRSLQQKYVLHLTMSGVRGVSMMRKTLSSIDDLAKMPSLLGSVFRTAVFGKDSFDYAALLASGPERLLQTWTDCRAFLGMHGHPEQLLHYNAPAFARKGSEDTPPHQRQQYV